MTQGTSRVSFALLHRHGVNDIFVYLSVAAGVTRPLANSERPRSFIPVTGPLLWHDEFATSYISYCSQYG